jgi:hypothetical protein
MKFPSIPHGTSPATTAALIEAVELLIGRRKNSTIDYGTIGGQAVPEFSLYNLGELIANLGGKNAHYARLGYLQRPVFSYVDADTLKIGPGVYHHMGTTDQFVEWDTDITLNVSVSGTRFYYLYISDEQIRRHGKSVLSADDFTLSLTAPTYKGTAHAWMNGLDRCIFAVQEYNTVMRKFFHDGGDFVQYLSPVQDRGFLDMTARVAVTLTIPAFAQKAVCLFGFTTNGEYFLRAAASDADGVYIGVGASGQQRSVTVSVITDSSQRVYMSLTDYTGTNSMQAWTNGWFFPAGM